EDRRAGALADPVAGADVLGGDFGGDRVAGGGAFERVEDDEAGGVGFDDAGEAAGVVAVAEVDRGVDQDEPAVSAGGAAAEVGGDPRAPTGAGAGSAFAGDPHDPAGGCLPGGPRQPVEGAQH